MKPTKKSSSPSKKYPAGSFMYKIKKRRIIETLSAFVGGGFLFYEIVHWILVDHYRLPEELKDITIVTLLCGLICTLILRWFGGEKKPRKIKAELFLIPLIVLITALLDIKFINQIRSHEAGTHERIEIDPNRIAVAVFENRTGDPRLANLGHMVRSRITEGIQQIGGISIASRMPDTQSEHRDREADFVRWFSRATYAGIVITGNYYLLSNNLQFDCEVHDAIKGELLHALRPQNAPIENPLVAIDNLRQSVMSRLAIIDEEELGRWVLTSSKPPSYEAYQEYINATLASNWSEAKAHFRKAHDLDSNFILPLLMISFIDINLGNWEEVEALLPKIEQYRDTLSPINRLLLDNHNARVSGDMIRAYRIALDALQIDPFSYWNLLAGYLANAINRPREAIRILRASDPNEGLMQDLRSYWDQLTKAYHTLGDYERELEEARKGRKQHPDQFLSLWHEMRPLAALGRIEEVERLIEESQNLLPRQNQNPGFIMLLAGRELKHQGYEEASLRILKGSIEWHSNRPRTETDTASYRYNLARVFYYSEMWEKAKPIFEALHREYPENVDYHGAVGSTLARMSDKEGALRISKELQELDRPYLFGAHLFRCSRIAAVLGEKENAMRLLRDALAQGLRYTDLHPTMDFETLWDYLPYKELIRPKG